MKKTISLLLIFVFCFLCIVPVNAEDNKQGFYFGWETDLVNVSTETETEALKLIGGVFGDNLPFGKNTVIIKSNIDIDTSSEVINGKFSMELELMDNKGNKVNEKTFDNIVYFNGITDDNYLYILAPNAIISDEKITDDRLFLHKINENLEIVKSLELDKRYSSSSDIFLYSMLSSIAGYNILKVDNEKIYLLDFEKGILSTTLNLDSWNVELGFIEEDNSESSTESSEKFIENNISEISKYFPDLSAEIKSIFNLIKKLENLEEVPDFDFDIDITTHINKDFILTSGVRFLHDRLPQTEPVVESITDALKNPSIELINDALGKNVADENSFPIVSLIKLVDNNGNVIFDKINENYLLFLDATVIGNHIVALGVPMSIATGDVSKFNVDIVVFNMNGDVVQTIENDGIYFRLNENDNGFVATNIKMCPKKVEEVNIEQSEPESTVEERYTICGFNTKAYYLNLNIDTKVTGKGNIKVMNASRKGDSVTFEIEPEPGYVLDFVKVIDAKGNVLTFKDYSFTMPSADVTIEANFLPENPSTFDGVFGSIVIAIVSISCALGLTVLLNNVRKEENL